MVFQKHMVEPVCAAGHLDMPQQAILRQAAEVAVYRRLAYRGMAARHFGIDLLRCGMVGKTKHGVQHKLLLDGVAFFHNGLLTYSLVQGKDMILY